MTEIKNKKDIKKLVDAFYDKVRQDPIIGGVFASRIADDDWSRHLERMYSFWNTVLFGQSDYRGNPFSKHRDLPIKEEHFNRWISLIKETIAQHFEGEKADEVVMRAHKMGDLFLSKLKYIRENEGFRNIM